MKERFHLIDALRGLCVVLMLGYHFGTTLIYFGIAGNGLIYNPLLNFLEPVFAGLFILISGISCSFSRNNVKRGLIVILCALVLTAVTSLPFVGLSVWFGILHFLGVSMVFYGLLSKWLNKIPFGAVLWLAVFIFTFIYFPRPTDNQYLFMLGYITPDFYYNDYFPLLKWFPLFLLGTQLGQPIKNHKLPQWFYDFNMPLLPFVGRHALVVYLAHQPVFGLFCFLFVTLLK